jgi:hypothetical protein
VREQRKGCDKREMIGQAREGLKDRIGKIVYLHLSLKSGCERHLVEAQSAV